ncbi:MAG: DNA-directed RNA polymerase subunit alpha [Candidatus Kerfeldbacteria bacterium]|nr:DNA-directed RNA polymerase subunit alpha [Candidatus Kerfeldbacteria bacterium]
MELQLPSQISAEMLADNRALFSISPCYPGYGTTLGNALRRVLLSSLPGAAITAVKIKGAEHEFSTMAHVKEDVVDILLNLKQVRFKIHSDEAVEVKLLVNGKKKITAKDFEKNNLVEIANPEQLIATLTNEAGKFELTTIVQKGRGYVPVEARENEKLEVGYMALDAVYTPIRVVNFNTEHVRVEQMTNYDKLMLDITTDGTVTPQVAFTQACQILVDHFNLLGNAVLAEAAV